ncbi:MAG: TolC family protein [Bacteroidales bacterium]
MNKLFLLTVALLAITSQSFAQKNYSLQELVQIALEENYQIQIMENQETIAKNKNTLGNAGFLPSVDIYSSQNWNIETSESNLYTGQVRKGNNAQNNQFDATAELNWTLFDGFRMFAKKEQLQHLVEMGKTETKYYVEQTISDLANVYYSLINAKKQLEIHQRSLNISGYRLELEKQKNEVGKGNALFFQQAKVDYNNDSNIVLNQKMAIQNKQIQINRIINKAPLSPVLPEKTSFKAEKVPELSQLIERALKNNKDLKRSKLEEMITEANYTMEKASRYPQVSAYGNYSFSKQESELGIVESAQSHGSNFGIQVRLNLYDGSKKQTAIKNAQIDKQNSNIAVNDKKASITAALTQLITQYNSLREQYLLLTENRKSSQKSLNIAKQQLKQGAINGYEFRQTQLAHLQTQRRIYELQYTLSTIKTDIYRISGTLTNNIM